MRKTKNPGTRSCIPGCLLCLTGASDAEILLGFEHLDVTVCDQTLGRKQIHFDLVRKDGKWLIRKEVQTLLPPPTGAEKKSMAKSLKLMGVKFEDEDENEFAGIYDDIDKAPFTRKGEEEKELKALWAKWQ